MLLAHCFRRGNKEGQSAHCLNPDSRYRIPLLSLLAQPAAE